MERVYLIGFMGSGKSTIGKYLANDMQWKFIDMDSYFEQKFETTITKFFAANGEQAFRTAESQILKELSQMKNVVIATGGGTPCRQENIDIMRATGPVVYINVEPAELCKRLSKAKAERPLIADKSDEELLSYIEGKLNEREPFYRQAHLIVDGVNLPFDSYKMMIEFCPFGKD